MRRMILYLVGAASLPWFGMFQDIVVYEGRAVRFHQGVYMQFPIGVACMVASLVLLLGIRKMTRRAHAQSRRVLPLWYGLFALPALVGLDRGAEFRHGDSIVEIASGIGGPYAWFLFLTAGLAFVCVEGWFRQLDGCRSAQ